MGKQRTISPRSRGTREISKKFLIMVEGTSEKNYFRRFIGRNSKLKVIPVQSSRHDAVSIAEASVKKCVEYGISKSNGDRCAVVYDVDQNPRDKIFSSEKICTRAEAEMYISNPSFECWLLMHFRGVDGNCTQETLEDALTEAMGRKYEKSGKINEKINDKMVLEAIRRSGMKICTREERNRDCLDRYPSSALHFLVGDILDI